MMNAQIPASVSAAFQQILPEARQALMEVRQLILDISQTNDVIGQVQETVKWGQPSYLPQKPRVGSTLRLWTHKDDGRPTLFTNCQSNLIEQIKNVYPDQFDYVGSRAIILRNPVSHDQEELKHIISMVLTYHLRKRKK